MTSRKNSKIQRALLKKGFEKVNTDHKVLIFYHDGKKTPIHTKVSHGNKEISDQLIGHMAKQVSLTKSEFEDVVDCHLQQNDLVKIYSEKGIL
jgi:predicted RNA binding protein YcfA (HicA-like mRNA interferase family)